MVDFDALEAAGIANARERAALIEYLDGLGFTADEMVAAERQGRLFGLSGDAVQQSGPPIFSLRTAADELGVPVEDVARVWAVLGLTVAGPERIVLSRADVDALTVWVTLRSTFGDDAALGFLRVTGAAMARITEAGATMFRVGQPELHILHTQDELTTARAYRDAGDLIAQIGKIVAAAYVHHALGVRTHVECGCGVGFADLSGFTALTQRLTPAELSLLLGEFNAVVTDVVHAHGGRVVKFIGDEVMWVSSTTERLVRTAADLVDHPPTRQAGLQIRAGISYGTVLSINGDYFGTAVNLAARLVGTAAPGQILATSEVRDALPGSNATALEPLTLKGFDAPVTAYDLHPSR